MQNSRLFDFIQKGTAHFLLGSVCLSLFFFFVDVLERKKKGNEKADKFVSCLVFALGFCRIMLDGLVFPTRSRVLAITVALSANGNSSYRDAANLVRLAGEVWPGRAKCVVLTDSPKSVRLREAADVELVKVETAEQLLGGIESAVKRDSAEMDVLFCVSAHGYSAPDATFPSELRESDGRKEFLRVLGTHRVWDHQLTRALYGGMDERCASLCLVDTCHSGTLLDLEYTSTDGVRFQRAPHVRSFSSFSGGGTVARVCISSCSDSELSGEDVSAYGGWGGKAVCFFLDFLNSRKQKKHSSSSAVNVMELYLAMKDLFNAQSRQRSHPVLSTTLRTTPHPLR